GKSDERECYRLGAELGILARVYGIHQERSSLLESAHPDRKRRELRSCTRFEPVVAEPAPKLVGLGEVRVRGVVSAERRLQQPGRQGRPPLERHVLLAKAIECLRRGLQRAIEVATEGEGPRYGQLRGTLEIG